MIVLLLVFVFLLVLNILPNAIHILLVSGILFALSYKYKKLFQKAYLFYIAAVVISVLSFLFYEESVTRYITSGIIGYGFLFTVMFMGVLPQKWTLTKHLKRNRGVFSILTFLLISPHALLHVFGFVGSVNLYGLAAYILMVPLTFISFRVIRKEIDPKDWFRIQKAAYIIYGLLFIHLLLVASWENKIVYAVLFTLYLNNKFIKEFVR